jgi:hypothetical protein
MAGIKPDPDLLEVQVSESGLVSGIPSSFDPWEKRNEFFRRDATDFPGLLRFLNSVGLFEKAGQSYKFETMSSILVPDTRGAHHRIEYPEQITAKHIWEMRRLLERALKDRSEIGEYADFEVRLVRIKGQPRVVLTTTTFLEALFLTLTVDRVQAAKVQKCARPDCGVTFAVSSRHERKYCDRYCAHIESVRRDRERKKQLLQSSKGKGKL